MKSVLTCNGRNVKDDVLTKVLFQTSIPLPFKVVKVKKSENRKSLVREPHTGVFNRDAWNSLFYLHQAG